MKKAISILLIALLCVVSIVGCQTEKKKEVKKSNFPTKEIEVVVPFAAGGGSSITGQIAAQIIDEEKYLPVRMRVVNKPGGNMAVGMAYTSAKKGDPYTLLLYTPLILTTPLLGDAGVNKDNFTQIAVFGYQLSLLCSKPGSQFNTFADVVNYAKANPGKLSISGAGVGGGQHLYAEILAKAAGFQYNFVPFAGSAEATAAVLGGHVDLAVVHLNEVSSFLEAKKLIALGIASKERISIVPNVPTFVEQGYNFVYGMPRGIVAPAGIPEDARQILGAAFKKLCESERWKKEYIDKYEFTADPLYLDDAKKYIDEQEKIYREILTEIGLIKK